MGEFREEGCNGRSISSAAESKKKIKIKKSKSKSKSRIKITQSKYHMTRERTGFLTSDKRKDERGVSAN